MYGKDRDGTGRPVQVTKTGALQLSEGLADAALNDRLFYVNTPTVVACTVTLATTWTGLGVCNPSNSGKIYIFHEFGWGITGVIANESLLQLAITDESGIAGAVTVKTAKAGGGMYSGALAFITDTITAPVVCKTIANLDQCAAAGKTYTSPPNILDLRGSIVLMPGQALVTNSEVVIGAVMSFHFMWEEIDV